ncbi:hypothetical protein GX408_01630 [bacterium]|nr:hypothetical protein [bacterium]
MKNLFVKRTMPSAAMLLVSGFLLFAMQRSGYSQSPPPTAARLVWHVMASGGTLTAAGNGIRLHGTYGQSAAQATEGPGLTVHAGFWCSVDLITSVPSDARPFMPALFKLEQNFPNPFNPMTTLGYHLPCQAQVRLQIYNLLGQCVRNLVQGVQKAGYHRVVWDSRDDFGRATGSGCYLYRIVAESVNELNSTAGARYSKTLSMLLLK